MIRGIFFLERKTLRIPQRYVAGDESALIAAIEEQYGWTVVRRTIEGNGDITLLVDAPASIGGG